MKLSDEIQLKLTVAEAAVVSRVLEKEAAELESCGPGGRRSVNDDVGRLQHVSRQLWNAELAVKINSELAELVTKVLLVARDEAAVTRPREEVLLSSFLARLSP